MTRTVMALLMLGSLVGAGAEGQERAEEGERIRVDHRVARGGAPETMEGWLIRIHPGDSIVVATRVDRDRVSFRTGLVDRFQVHRITSHGARGGVIGILGGALLTFPFTSSECSDTRNDVCLSRGTILYGAAGGLLFGSLIGSFLEVEKWVDVAPQSFRGPFIQPALTFDGGVGFSATVTLGH